MRIVTRGELMRLPIGTLYQEYEPHCWGEICIKGKTCVSDGDNIDWFCMQLQQPAGNMQEWTADLEAHNRCEMDFDIQGRDGCFDHDQLYAVWERSEVRQLIRRLNQALDGEDCYTEEAQWRS